MSGRGRGQGGGRGGGRGQGGGGRGGGRGGGERPYTAAGRGAGGGEDFPALGGGPRQQPQQQHPRQAPAPQSRYEPQESMEELERGVEELSVRGSAPGPVTALSMEPAVAFEIDESLINMNRVRPIRPGVGSKGKPIKLYSNFFSMSIPDHDFYHYDVDIKPECPPAINHDVMNLWRKAEGSKEAKIAVYDGRKNIFTPRHIVSVKPEVGLEIVVSLPEEGKTEYRKFTVIVHLVATVNMERLHKFLEGKGENEAPRDTLQVLDVLFKSIPTALYTSVTRKTGGSFYSSYEPNFNISGGLNLRNGWKQSIRPTFHEVLLNIDVATTAFYQEGPLVDVVARFFNKNRIQDVPPKCFAPNTIEFQRLSKFLATVMIEITYRSTGRRKYKIQRLHKFGSDKAVLTPEPGAPKNARKLTVQQYFKETFNKDIQYPHLPCVECGSGGQILIPMEMCLVRPNQRHLGKLSDVQTSDVIKIAAVQPPSRFDRIKAGMNALHQKPEAQKLLADWEVKLSPKPKELDARILPTPTLQGSGEIRPQNGSYDYSKIPTKFYRPATLTVWAVAVFGRHQNMPFDSLVGFVSDVFKGCRSKGMTIAERDFNSVVVPQMNMSVEDTLAAANEKGVKAAGNAKPRCEMVFCVFENGKDFYEEIKMAAETKLNLMTQCFLAKHLRGPKPGVTVNLALKINSKLGGVNTVIDPKVQLNVLGQPIPTMIMGADVTHPPPGVDGGVSIAAVVASMDA
ncbi:Eukaryotic translation initiation factor 2C, partial [Blyttiomyces sp. JEL0837]